MRIILLAGGSGGHISPAFAVATELKKLHPDADAIFFCSRNTVDRTIYEQSSHKYVRIFSGKVRRYFSYKNFTDPFLMFLGFLQSFFLLLRLKPDIVFSKGGFVAVPPAFAAFLLRIPIVTHECDAAPGLATKFISHFARKTLTSFPTGSGIYTGNPIRPEILAADANKGKELHKFEDPAKPILLVFGGSQGSKLLNSLVTRLRPKLLKSANLVLVSGAKEIIAPRANGYREYPYLHDRFADALAAADVVVSRAGSSSIFECAVLKKAMVLIPLASSAANHQEKNAEIFQNHSAAKVIYERDLTDDLFLKTVTELLSDQVAKKTIGNRAFELARPAAAEEIATQILKMATGHKTSGRY